MCYSTIVFMYTIVPSVLRLVNLFKMHQGVFMENGTKFICDNPVYFPEITNNTLLDEDSFLFDYEFDNINNTNEEEFEKNVIALLLS